MIIMHLLAVVFFMSDVVPVFAVTVSGGGYNVEQNLAPLQGAVTGNGYSVQQSTQQPLSGIQSGSGFSLFGVFGRGVTPSPPSPPPVTGGGVVISNGGYYVIIPPRNATPTVTYTTASGTVTETVIDRFNSVTSMVASTTKINITVPPSNNTCTSRITFSAPIDYGLTTNVKADVMKLETFLNIYEGENLLVNGIYERRDVEAVKRWQEKYRSFVLDPMLLRNPTGTIYTLSQRQIERQTTKPCGEPIVVTACPYFKSYSSYGDRGQEVKKVQQFLNIVRGEKLPLSGVYGPLTRAATLRFQRAYRKDIFSILNWSFISGNWNEATRVKANQAIGCDVVR